MLNVLSTAGASILAVGYLLPIIYLTYSVIAGEKAPADPWGARGLEWEIPSPPPTENFTVTPVVTELHAPVRARARRSALPDAHAEHFPGPIHQPPLVSNVDAIQPGEHIEHAHHPKLQHHFDDMEQQVEASGARHVGVPGHRNHVLRRPVHGLPGLPLGIAGSVPGGQPPSRHPLGRFNTAVLIFSSLTMALAVRAAQTNLSRKVQVGWLLATMFLGTVFLGVKVIEYADKFEHHIVPGPHFDKSAWTHPAGVETVLLALLHHDRAARRAHGDRHRPHDGDRDDGVEAQFYAVLHAGRSVGPVLALRRHRLDLPVPAALPDRPPLSREWAGGPASVGVDGSDWISVGED